MSGSRRIENIKGAKPRLRASKIPRLPESEKSVRLGEDYLRKRSQVLDIKLKRESMRLAHERAELIEKSLVERQLAWLLISMRQSLLLLAPKIGNRSVIATCRSALCGSLHRAARPEVQLNLIQQNNVTENHLVINITGPEAKAIEVQAEPIRAEVAAMIARYRPLSGNGENVVRDVEAEAVSSAPAQSTVITHKAGDEKNQGFWKMLVSSNPESFVAKETAVFAIRTLLAWLRGYKAHRMQIDFDGDPVTVEEMFSRFEKLCGGASGWQLAQKLGGRFGDLRTEVCLDQR